MTRKETLDRAAACVLQDRETQYGAPEDTFGRIAQMWSAYLAHSVHPHDVAVMMALLKVARIAGGQAHDDNYVDLAGYAACAAELAARE